MIFAWFGAGVATFAVAVLFRILARAYRTTDLKTFYEIVGKILSTSVIYGFILWLLYQLISPTLF